MERILHIFFLTSPSDKYYTARDLKEMYYERTGKWPSENKWTYQFKKFREETKMPIWQVYYQGEWRYIKSENPAIIQRHDKQIERQKQLKENNKSYNRKRA